MFGRKKFPNSQPKFLFVNSDFFSAQKTNELISAHAKTLRTSQLETATAIAKINEIRGHAKGFAENMLAKATGGLAPDP